MYPLVGLLLACWRRPDCRRGALRHIGFVLVASGILDPIAALGLQMVVSSMCWMSFGICDAHGRCLLGGGLHRSAATLHVGFWAYSVRSALVHSGSEVLMYAPVMCRIALKKLGASCKATETSL